MDELRYQVDLLSAMNLRLTNDEKVLPVSNRSYFIVNKINIKKCIA